MVCDLDCFNCHYGDCINDSLVCNRDCFNCPYDDCIDDTYTDDDREISASVDRIILKTTNTPEEIDKKQRDKERKKSYYEAHRDEILARKKGDPEIARKRKERYERDKPRWLAYQKEYEAKHKEHKTAYMMEYRHRDIEKSREYWREYQRKYRAEHRDEINAAARARWKTRKEKKNADKAKL